MTAFTQPTASCGSHQADPIQAPPRSDRRSSKATARTVRRFHHDAEIVTGSGPAMPSCRRCPCVRSPHRRLRQDH